MSTPSVTDLRARLSELSLRDERRLRRRLDGTRRIKREDARAEALTEIASEVDAAEQRIASRVARRPRLVYPDELPVSQRKDDIAAAIRDNQVVIVAGETGSGKTTQLPKICLELGRGIRGAIGHTQPRRLAARTVAERIAEETTSELGEAVGYQVRFTRKAGDDTLVKLMTDGILLNELGQDRMLRRYDTLIIDEAHERSLNIDFILGYLKQLLPRRPDLKVIITSATIDPERFSAHFDDAPIIEVSGRTYPVEIRYRPLVADAADADAATNGSSNEPRDQVQAIVDAVDELALEPPGDVLVFLSGEREIRDTADALRKRYENTRHRGATTEVLPLYARLSAAEQHRVFQPHTGRRIVLATNVAETSLTVPGIRYVVDTGTARISRYSQRTKVQRLPIEPISQASARQRAGRCGRTADGICIRLYSEEDFESRPAFTDPEILRTNLASVILQMTALDLGNVADFPFIDPPERRSISAGFDLLHELGALDPKEQDPKKRLTDIGRKLAQLPVDPRLGRMILEADRQGCASEVIVLAAALSIQDPRERPADQQQAADEKHARFIDPTSDFAALLNLWNYLRDEKSARSSNQFRKMCRTEYLNYLRVREWQDLEAQLRNLVKPLGVTVNETPGGADEIHRSLLAGLLSHIGVKEGSANEYLGARGTKFAIFPGSGLFKKPPQCVMAAELVETSRLWARVNARIDPEWAESLASHLVKRTYSEPHWSKKAGAVLAYEKVTLYGVPIVSGRRVQYSKIEPELCRELFIRHALVEGDWETRHRFFHENRELLEDVEDLEHRARRRDIVVDDHTLFEFYDQRIPAHVVSARHFDSWWKKARQQDPELLTFTTDLLTTDAAETVTAEDYPDAWRQGEHELPLTYQFEPGASTDGVSVDVPLPVLNQVDPTGFDWQVPGMREELVTALIKALPKDLRRSFVPAPDTARQVLASIDQGDVSGSANAGPSPSTSLTQALARELTRLRAVPISPEDFDLSRVPDHLKVTFRVVDEHGKALAEGKDLGALKHRLRSDMRQSVGRAAASIERSGLREWSVGTVPRTFEQQQHGHVVTGYPALVDEGDSVALKVLHTEADQQAAHPAGVRRLLVLSIPSPVTFVQRHLTNETKLMLSNAPHGSVADLLWDCTDCTADALIADAGGPPWDEAGFTALREKVRGQLIEQVFAVVEDVERILTIAHRVRTHLSRSKDMAIAPSLVDAKDHLDQLIYRGFVTSTGRKRLPDLVRYVTAIERRLDKLPASPQRDRLHMDTIARVQEAYHEMLDALPPDQPPGPEHDAIHWMIEELHVSLFAQDVGTAHPVSEKRILRAISQLR
ncbi:ATP-dependent RNA helicase HrpA [Actinobacteria bacterium YIM 96077]|uniref:RNA helicase n=1 Tax=Phytoactinopolyspora halophila TaxID=1981511 RepID=A0A329R1T5_9ACTN|nr:ATP-dependent RNA helicase HrpA [Phytoactinopolyspora halophila]AYY12237.1 ATP-dependent RNA helicase HrpA [Actinobacteria bacterium YIM 96077]RAW18530.1 ATP-dependent RNA helicase HrpA [Phytoactinopolyspora halophila]